MGGRDLLQSQNRVSGRCLAVGGVGHRRVTGDSRLQLKVQAVPGSTSNWIS